MSSAIVDGTNIDVTVFDYSKPKPNDAGGKVVNLYNKNFKESFTIAVPMMPCWGAQEVMENKKDDNGQPIKIPTGKYTMSLTFPTTEYATEDTNKFLEEMKKVEHQIKLDAIARSKDWFGKEIKSMEVMDEKISPMLKYPKLQGSEERDYNKPPTLTVKIPCWKGVWQPSIFDEDYNPLYVKGKSAPDVSPLDFLRQNGKGPIQVICLIQCAGLWFVGSPSKVSITWNLKQAIVKKPRQSTINDDLCFLNIKASDREMLKSMPETENVDPDGVSTSAIIEDDEPPVQVAVPETIVSPVVEPVPEPEPVVQAKEPTAAPKKKLITKKKVEA